MLALTRKTGESITIGQDVTVKVLKTGHTVTLGIDAPRSVPVTRGDSRRAVVDPPDVNRELEWLASCLLTAASAVRHCRPGDEEWDRRLSDLSMWAAEVVAEGVSK